MRQLILAAALAAWVALAAAQGDGLRAADAQIERGDSLYALGHHEEAGRAFEAAARAAAAANDAAREAAALVGIALVQHARGATAAALEQLARAGERADASGRTDLQARVLLNRGYFAAVAADLRGALEHFERAASTGERSGARGQQGLVARALVNAARAAHEVKMAARASALLPRALAATAALPEGADKALLLVSLGELQTRRGEPLDAHRSLERALGIADRLGDERARSHALGNLGRLYASSGRNADAAGLFERAVAAAQRLNAHEILFRWYWDLGRAQVALRAPDAALAAYRAAVRHLQEVRADVATSVSSETLSFRQALGPLYDELADLLLARSAAGAAGDERQALLREARATVELSKAAELEDYFNDGCVAAQSARIGELENVGAKSAVIYPVLLRDRLELLVSHARGFEQVTVPIEADKLSAEVRAFRERLEKRTTRQYLVNAQRLYELLFRPLEPLLERIGAETLVVVPDGALRTVPFAALHDGKQFLVSRFAFATTPGLALTDPRPLPEANLRMLVSALTESVQGFSALPNVEAELAAILALYDANVLRDRGYLVERLGEELARRPYSIVHIASHGQFDRDPRQTFLLAYDGKIGMDELERIIAPSRSRERALELLTLSACQTAAGDDRAALGLAGIAIKAGARSALASLWFINDESSAALVKEFYADLRQPGSSKARALRAAQLKLLQDPRFNHPAYWAPFLLIGNWL